MPAWQTLNNLSRMMEKWRALESWERHLLIRLFFLLPAAWISLRVLGFNKTRETAELKLQSASMKAEHTPIDFAQRCAELTGIAAYHGFYRANCLHQSLALCQILRGEGLPARLRIGVLPGAKPFQAHAWVELHGVPLGKQSISEYQAFERLNVDQDTPQLD